MIVKFLKCVSDKIYNRFYTDDSYLCSFRKKEIKFRYFVIKSIIEYSFYQNNTLPSCVLSAIVRHELHINVAQFYHNMSKMEDADLISCCKIQDIRYYSITNKGLNLYKDLPSDLIGQFKI